MPSDGMTYLKVLLLDFSLPSPGRDLGTHKFPITLHIADIQNLEAAFLTRITMALHIQKLRDQDHGDFVSMPFFWLDGTHCEAPNLHATDALLRHAQSS